MCGEKSDKRRARLSFAGSPPRVRGEVRRCFFPFAVKRITPACAGRSGRLLPHLTPPPDHPRVRGEKYRCALRARSTLGSPPRARGEVRRLLNHGDEAGITPACAGRRFREVENVQGL